MVMVKFGTSSAFRGWVRFRVLVDGRCASRISSECLKCVSGEN